MKTLRRIYHHFFTKGFDERLRKAEQTYDMILQSTYAGISHFHNTKGEKIRNRY